MALKCHSRSQIVVLFDGKHAISIVVQLWLYRYLVPFRRYHMYSARDHLWLVLCDTWNHSDDNDTASGIAILDTTAIPEMRYAQGGNCRGVEILPRDWNLKPIFTHKWASVEWTRGFNPPGEGGSTPRGSPPVHVYRRSFLGENRLQISIPGQNFKHFGSWPPVLLGQFQHWLRNFNVVR